MKVLTKNNLNYNCSGKFILGLVSGTKPLWDKTILFKNLVLVKKLEVSKYKTELIFGSKFILIVYYKEEEINPTTI